MNWKFEIMFKFKIVTLSLLVGFTTSCTTSYKDVEVGSPIAKFNFIHQDNPELRKFDVQHTFTATPSGTCSEQQRLGIISYRSNYEPTSKDILSGKPINLLVQTGFPTVSVQTASGTSFGGGYKDCKSLASFTPQKDHEYKITHEGNPLKNTCLLVIIDEASKSQPLDLIINNKFECPK